MDAEYEKSDCTVFCRKWQGMCKATQGHETGEMDCSSGKRKAQSFSHDLDELVSKSRGLCEVLMETKMEEGRIRWYPWGVQITVTC